MRSQVSEGGGILLSGEDDIFGSFRRLCLEKILEKFLRKIFEFLTIETSEIFQKIYTKKFKNFPRKTRLPNKLLLARAAVQISH